MCKYRSIIENPEKLRSMTGLTTEEFHALVPIFHTAFEAYMKRRTIDGRVRYCRRYVSYANSPLPTTEDKLLDFIKICFDFRTAFCVSAKFGSYAAHNMFP